MSNVPIAVLATALALTGCVHPPSPSFESGQWIDLTHSFSSETLYWPTAQPFALAKEFDGTTQKGYHYSANRYAASEHGGTHVDAPIHFAEAAATVDRMALEQCIGTAVIIDVSAKALKNRDYLINTNDLQAWEKEHGTIPSSAIVLFHTGYDRFWPDPTAYLGTHERGPGAVEKLHFPGVAPEATRWLVEQRHIKAIGLDTASIDYGQSTQFETHQILARHGIPIFENVAGLSELPATGTWVFALPMKIGGGSGAPLRIVAFLPH